MAPAVRRLVALVVVFVVVAVPAVLIVQMNAARDRQGAAGNPADPELPPGTPLGGSLTTAVTGEGCTDEILDRTVCGFVEAVLRGDLARLTDTERTVATDLTLPRSPWRMGDCTLVGDVTAECVVAFNGGPGQADDVRTFSVQPANGEYMDGEIVLPDGEELAYQVIAHANT